MLFSSLADQDKSPLTENTLAYTDIYTMWIPPGAGFGHCFVSSLKALTFLQSYFAFKLQLGQNAVGNCVLEFFIQRSVLLSWDLMNI